MVKRHISQIKQQNIIEVHYSSTFWYQRDFYFSFTHLLPFTNFQFLVREPGEGKPDWKHSLIGICNGTEFGKVQTKQISKIDGYFWDWIMEVKIYGKPNWQKENRPGRHAKHNMY